MGIKDGVVGVKGVMGSRAGQVKGWWDSMDGGVKRVVGVKG